jgi:hypothetical protein
MNEKLTDYHKTLKILEIPLQFFYLTLIRYYAIECNFFLFHLHAVSLVLSHFFHLFFISIKHFFLFSIFLRYIDSLLMLLNDITLMRSVVEIRRFPLSRWWFNFTIIIVVILYCRCCHYFYCYVVQCYNNKTHTQKKIMKRCRLMLQRIESEWVT